MLAGRPIVGVWISAALFASALCWMLQGWFPPRWAVLGTLVGVSCMVLSGRANDGGILAYWSQSYWGGAASALGGCLLLGGLRRVVDRACWAASAALGAGVSILALTRPFEGLLVCIPVALALAGWFLWSRRATLPAKLLRVALPAAAVLALAAGWLALYNQRVAGAP
ncbi:MAG: hypothetical protein WD749_00040, partial [Phycisphaerales bacterium]